ncbi:MAG: D-TA family PLP-dependent enzyme [Chitinophagaceae bacterium]|nr:D-TA family PLP-dependent enzyme [Chitinophagaceae bacterium]
MELAYESWYWVENADQLDSPALLIYPDRVKENIRILTGMIDDVARLRPHVKTNKTKEATALMMQAGINKFKCATIAEAEMLGMCSAKDVLLAYQPVGPKLQRFASVIKKYPATKFSCLVDNVSAAKQQDKIFSDAALSVDVYLDLNTGMGRTGIAPGDAALQLYKEASGMKGIHPVGLHAYDGHIRPLDFNEKKAECDKAFAAVENFKNQIMDAGLPEPVIVAGGTPTFSVHCKREKIECSPGTFIYWDKGYSDLCKEQKFLTAAVLVTRVVSLPTETRLCLDLGHKSVAAENEITKRVFFLNAPELKPVGQSEEHLVLDAGPNHPYKVGDILYALPYHVCPTCALYERAYTAEGHRITGEWKMIARDRKISC